MRKLMAVVFALLGIAAFTTIAMSADDLIKAVKERRHLMKDVVGENTKLGGDTLKGKVKYDADKLAKAMTAISEVPDKYVTLFPKGSEQGAVKDSKALPKIWEDFDGFKEDAEKLKKASAKAAEAAVQGQDAFAAAFKDMTKACKDCHETYRAKVED
jgi:cytochrome c556